MAPETTETSKKRGTKRKRLSGKPRLVKQESQAQVVGKKLHHGLHEVRKAAKKAVAFELRKQVKRIKAARSQDRKSNAKGNDPAEMERQLEVLKCADYEQFANTALRTKILKDRLLSRNEGVAAAMADKLSTNLASPQSPGSSAARVHGRLLSSKTIAEAVHAAVESLRMVVDPSLAKGKEKTSVKMVVEEEGEDEDEDEEDGGMEERPTQGKKARSVDASENEDEEGEEDSGSEEEAEDAGWESGTVDGGDGDGWESGSVRGGASSDEKSEDGDDDDESADEPPKPKSKPASTKDPAGKPKAAAGESTFLPSLAVGFTRGDSDASDFSDDEAAADAPRKNRRGQRARRAIWEKKYGRNANHVKKQRDMAEQDPRQSGRGRPAGGGSKGKPDFRGGRDGLNAVSGLGHGNGALRRGGTQTLGGRKMYAAPSHVSSASAVGGTSKGSEDKPLHPSWEAKRKMKEKLSAGIVPALGKKITF